MMLGRGRPIKSDLSGASSGHGSVQRLVEASEPTTHGLLVALVSAEHPRVEAAAWPLWLVPGLNRRPGRGPRSHSLRE